ncbi:2,5-dioxovalerate dehydrogenase [Catellatospora sp. TT07R-123]|uniref:aldehyde dehydrogenase family protein n=1 Tax=Catellatospora sp. TT07R-123 TaxID=2733863 RepID=UPI001B0A1DB3|nr:aldehyde dehydrogenase family protein [Catellatospora sp. TT07R-123]GHJ43684.1 2,5-dioxovalerate dehydrogenase [Catellatospora sp. TT07R-123]
MNVMDVMKAVARAVQAAPTMAATGAGARRDMLHACADAVLAAGDEVVATALAETGLTEARLRGELDRTANQFRLLGDHAAKPWRRVSAGVAAGGADLVTVPVPVGPVAVFAASNFPLAFGVSGGDTASALAAGCPVVVKAHPAQPRTGRLLGRLLAAALPDGAFSLVAGGPEVSLELVRAPGVKAVGFTGSLRGGRALMDAASARPDPIPVYAEMGSLNPVLVLPGASGDATVAALAAAVTGSAGQLCTKPGLVLAGSAAFADALAAAVAAAPVHRMLTEPMGQAHQGWLAAASARHRVVAGAGEPVPFAVVVDVAELAGELLEEHFGPSVVIGVGAPEQALDRLDGSLTASVYAADGDRDAAAALLPGLLARAGRIVWNGVPTGVAVCDAMHHGGPWPATSAPWSTSVGTEAVERFRRPVALQGLPPELLP